MPSIAKVIVRDALAIFRRKWPDLLVTDIVFKTLAFAVLAPLSGLILRVLLAASGSPVVADTDIIFFVLSPIGIISLIVVGAVSLAIFGLEEAGLMVVAYGAASSRRVSYRSALRFLADAWRPILSLTGRIVIRALLIATPFLAVGGFVFLWLLTEFDINYYIATKPPDFWLAVVLIGSILGLGALAIGHAAVGWLMAFPILLFERTSPADALQSAKGRVVGGRKVAATILAAWVLLGVGLSWLATGAVMLLGRVLPMLIGNSASLILVVTGGVLLVWTVANSLVAFVSTSAFALFVVGLYREVGEPENTADSWASAWERLDERQAWAPSRRQLLVALLVAVPLAAIVGAVSLQGAAPESNAAITAHRGASMAAPENTVSAVERAMKQGTDWVEIDVQETADGRVVVIHDSDLRRVGGTNLSVADSTYEQLRDTDIGSWFAPQFADQRLPTLEQVLEMCRDRAGVNIELKFYGREVRLEERVIEIVESMGMESQIVVMSLKNASVRKMKALRPDWTIGLLTAVAIGDLTRVPADFLAVNSGLATLAFVRAAHRAGKEVQVWTVNDPLTAFALIARGVDAVITDRPAMVGRVLQAHAEMTAVERFVAEVAILIGVVEIDDDEPEEIG